MDKNVHFFIKHPVHEKFAVEKKIALAMFLSALLENLPFCQLIHEMNSYPSSVQVAFSLAK